MKKIILFLSLILITFNIYSQTINGQWRGYFNSGNSMSLIGNSDDNEYILDFEIVGEKVTGISITTFIDYGKKYFVTCKILGTYDKFEKKINVTETERIRGNTPPGFNDCLQTHIVRYKKLDNKEVLEGVWRSAPGYSCGNGKTILTRKINTNSVLNNLGKKPNTLRPSPNQPRTNIAINRTKATTGKNSVARNVPANKSKSNLPLKPAPTKPINTPLAAKAKPKLKLPIAKDIKKPIVVNPSVNKINEVPIVKKIEESKKIIIPKIIENRINDVQKTIPIYNKEFSVKLYDNGEIDGDIISLYYNGELILENKTLSDKPIIVKLTALKDQVNELVMNAKNLGSIPPNTALMVVIDGDNRYEVRVNSDEKQNGAIRFIGK